MMKIEDSIEEELVTKSFFFSYGIAINFTIIKIATNQIRFQTKKRSRVHLINNKIYLLSD